MPDEPTLDDEWTAETNIWALEGRRNDDGSLRGVSCRSRWCEARENESGEFQIRRKMVAECDYHVEDGIARLTQLGDRESEIPEDAIEPMLLRTVPAAERAVARVPGVERVERIEETLGGFIEDGRAAIGEDE
jgi:hypothetical protein